MQYSGAKPEKVVDVPGHGAVVLNGDYERARAHYLPMIEVH